MNSGDIPTVPGDPANLFISLPVNGIGDLEGIDIPARDTIAEIIKIAWPGPGTDNSVELLKKVLSVEIEAKQPHPSGNQKEYVAGLFGKVLVGSFNANALQNPKLAEALMRLTNLERGKVEEFLRDMNSPEKHDNAQTQLAAAVQSAVNAAIHKEVEAQRVRSKLVLSEGRKAGMPDGPDTVLQAIAYMASRPSPFGKFIAEDLQKEIDRPKAGLASPDALVEARSIGTDLFNAVKYDPTLTDAFEHVARGPNLKPSRIEKLLRQSAREVNLGLAEIQESTQAFYPETPEEKDPRPKQREAGYEHLGEAIKIDRELSKSAIEGVDASLKNPAETPSVPGIKKGTVPDGP